MSATTRVPLVLFVANQSTENDRAATACAASGMEVVQAINGDEALGLFAQRSPDAVVVEAALAPDATYCGGLDVCEKLQSLPGGAVTPILILLPGNDLVVIEQAYRSGASDCLIPPVDARVIGPRLDH